MAECDRSVSNELETILEFVRVDEDNFNLFKLAITFVSNPMLACLYYAGVFNDDTRMLPVVCHVAALRVAEYEDACGLVARMIRENEGK